MPAYDTKSLDKTLVAHEPDPGVIDYFDQTMGSYLYLHWSEQTVAPVTGRLLVKGTDRPRWYIRMDAHKNCMRPEYLRQTN